jgi:hypothetical protein
MAPGNGDPDFCARWALLGAMGLQVGMRMGTAQDVAPSPRSSNSSSGFRAVRWVNWEGVPASLASGARTAHRPLSAETSSDILGRRTRSLNGATMQFGVGMECRRQSVGGRQRSIHVRGRWIAGGPSTLVNVETRATALMRPYNDPRVREIMGTLPITLRDITWPRFWRRRVFCWIDARYLIVELGRH